MIYAKTGMEKMPDQCRECDLSNEKPYGTYCFISGCRICVDGIRSNCPLIAVRNDTELPSEQDDRLGNGG